MTIRLPLENNKDFTISPARWQNLKGLLKLDEIKYSDGPSVREARKKITEMGVWDTFVDDFFNSGSKQKALNAIVTIIFRAKADELHTCMPAEELSDDNVNNAKYELVTLLSPHGALRFAGSSADTGKGIQFFPQTGYREFDALLGTVFPYGLAALVREKAGMHYEAAQAWEKSALAWVSSDPVLAVEAYTKAASQWDSIRCDESAKIARAKANEIINEREDAANEAAKGGHYDIVASHYLKIREMWAAVGVNHMEIAANLKWQRAKEMAEESKGSQSNGM